MNEVTAHFVGFITGCDESILKLKLGDGLAFELWDQDRAVSLVADVAEMSESAARHLLFVEFHALIPARRIVIIHGEYPVNTASRSKLGVQWPHREIENVLVGPINRLHALFPLTHLFKPSPIMMRAFYSYWEDGGMNRPSMSGTSGIPLYGKELTLTDEDARNLESFLKENSLPLGRPHLDYAFQISELSLQILSTGIAFATTMMGFDALVGDEGNRARWRIASGTASLLADSEQEYIQIRSEMNSAYDLRSAILHQPDPRKANAEAVASLRQRLAQGIRAALMIPGDKAALLYELEQRAERFGDLPGN